MNHLRPKIALAENKVKEQEEGGRDLTIMYDRKRNRQILCSKGVEMNKKTQRKKSFEISHKSPVYSHLYM